QAVQCVPRSWVMDARGVVPLFVEVGDSTAQFADAVMHGPIGDLVRAVEKQLRRRSPAWVPVVAHALQVACNSPRGKDDCRPLCGEGPTGLLVDPFTTAYPPFVDPQSIDPMSEADGQVRQLRMVEQLRLK